MKRKEKKKEYLGKTSKFLSKSSRSKEYEIPTQSTHK